MCEKAPVAVEGELFLNGPDESRVKISCGQDLAVELCQVISEGTPASDRKDQGIGALSVTYESGTRQYFEITNTGLVRRAGRVVQVDQSSLLPLLRRMAEECSR